MINRKWIQGGRIAAAFFMAALLFVGASEIGEVNKVPHLIHLVEHFLYYGFMALLLALGLGRRWFWLALLVVPLVGALDEWHQFYVPGRGSSAWDWLTDVAGAGVAVYVYRRWAAKRERP
ncbi:MAG TPA: VanZ family protein [Burkholderiales bacterium]